MILALALLALLQAPDPRRVDEAIRKGVAYLRGPMGQAQGHNAPGDRWTRYDELALWTFLHAGVPETDPDFRRLFRAVTESRLERTYLVSLQAMILEELDRVRYQDRLRQCGQFLADNMAHNGQWSYGDPSPAAEGVPTQGRAATATAGTPTRRISKPKVVRFASVRKRAPGPESGDNSNSQYAALGLRACQDAGILFEPGLLKQARAWWRQSQKKSGSSQDGRGWCYAMDDVHAAYGSMTAGATASLVIYDHLLGEKWENDRDVREGLQWVTAHFSVTENVGPPESDGGGVKKTNWMYYYYLYALERLGVLAGTERFGAREWYPEGAAAILAAQNPDGSWLSKDALWGNAIWDTCFAILFLRRATRPFEDVATPGSRR